MKIIRPHAITDAILTASNVAETDYTAYNPATTYASGDRVRVVAADVHEVYESLQNANTGNTPSTSPTWWVKVGATNRWKMFDLYVNTQTENADSIAITLACVGRVDAVALINVSAATARFRMTDAVDGVVYDQTYDLTSDSGITDHYAYCFEPIVRKTSLGEFELPPYSDTTLEITLTATGETVKCGACVVGQQRIIGNTRFGYSLGIQDYSIKSRDTWGNTTLVQRAYNDTGRFNVQLDNGMVDEVHNLLAQYRATPIVYSGSELHGAALLLGFYKDFSVVVDFGTHSSCNIDIEALT